MKYAAQKALDAFKKIKACTVNVWDVDDEIESLEKAIVEAEKQEQGEPVTFEEWLSKQHGDPEEIGFLQALRIAYISGQDSITTPQQRTWVGLTDDQIEPIAIDVLGYGALREQDMELFTQSVRAIEAKLKEKNT